MQEIIKNTFMLTIILIVAGALLSYVYGVTSPIVDLHDHENMINTIKELFPNADKNTDEGEYLSVFSGNNLLGYVVLTSQYGYSSEIEIMVGYNKQKEIIGVKILKQQETPGIGTKIIEDSFLSQFSQLEKSHLDAITGATVSSSAVIEAVSNTRGVLP